MRMTNAIYDRHPWLGWKNVKKRFQRGELQNLLTPVTNDILSTCWGGPLHLVRFADRPNILGNIIACWTPIDSHSHYVLDLTLLPKMPVPVVGPLVEKAVGFAAGLGNWSTAIQDAGLMMHRLGAPESRLPRPGSGPCDLPAVLGQPHRERRSAGGGQPAQQRRPGRYPGEAGRERRHERPADAAACGERRPPPWWSGGGGRAPSDVTSLRKLANREGITTWSAWRKGRVG